MLGMMHVICGCLFVLGGVMAFVALEGLATEFVLLGAGTLLIGLGLYELDKPRSRRR